MVDRDRVKQLYRKWEEALEEENDAASRASFVFEELLGEGIDPNDPPEWLQ
jgi:hypothetical protein